MEIEENQRKPTIVERLTECEDLLFTLMSDVDKILRVFSKNVANAMGSPQNFEPLSPNEFDDREIEDNYLESTKIVNVLSQKLNRITKDLPLEIPKQKKTGNCKGFQCQNLTQIIENRLNEINEIIEKERHLFPIIPSHSQSLNNMNAMLDP